MNRPVRSGSVVRAPGRGPGVAGEERQRLPGGDHRPRRMSVVGVPGEHTAQHDRVHRDDVVDGSEEPSLDRSEDARHDAAPPDRPVLLRGIGIDVVRPEDHPRARVQEPVDDRRDQDVRRRREDHDDVLTRERDEPNGGAHQERQVVPQAAGRVRLPEGRRPQADHLRRAARRPRRLRTVAFGRPPQVRAASADHGDPVPELRPMLGDRCREMRRWREVRRVEQVDERHAHAAPPSQRAGRAAPEGPRPAPGGPGRSGTRRWGSGLEYQRASAR